MTNSGEFSDEVQIVMQRMPHIWDDTGFYTSIKSVVGELANWAIRQSPYTYPVNLEKAIDQFFYHFRNILKVNEVEIISDGIFETSCNELEGWVNDTIDLCGYIRQWNTPKIGGGQSVNFVTSDSKPKPDYDFIDLGALAKNIAHSVTVKEKFDKEHN